MSGYLGLFERTSIPRQIVTKKIRKKIHKVFRKKIKLKFCLRIDFLWVRRLVAANRKDTP
jgi:hypothetical protein